MSQDILILLAIAVLAVSAYLFRKWYLSLSKSYKVSEQYLAGKKLTITEHNPRKDTATLELKITSNKAFDEPSGVFIEFIDSKNERLKYALHELEINDVENHFSSDKKTCTYIFEKRDLMRGIRNANISLFRFRFTIALDANTLIKSHIFGFSSRYMLFRPDIGKFN